MSIVERALQKAGAAARANNQIPAAAPAAPAPPPAPVPEATPKAEAPPRAEAPRAEPQQRVERRAVAKRAQANDFPDNSGRFVEIKPEDMHAVGLGAPHTMQARIAEELRLIKRPLLLNAENEEAHVANGNLVMIGSALPGSGKTFLSLNLAMSMASELDWTVLLIDADVSRPTLSRKLGLGDAPGLVNLLEEDRDFVDYVYKTNVPGLHVLPAGPPRANVKELLGSRRMRALIAALTEHHRRRIVLFDSPPLLLTSEARVVASYVGQILLVVEAGITPRRSLLDAIETLDHTKAINLVLNKSWQALGMGDYHYAAYGPYGRDDGNSKTEG